MSGLQISALVGTFMWPFIRISAMFLAAPILGTRMIPVRVRVILAVTLTLVVAPLLPPPPAVDVLSAEGLLITLHQVLIGATMGFIVQMVFAALVMAGEQMAFAMGLGFASMVDPQNGVTVPVVSQFFTIIATLLYLAMNGHEIAIEILVETFYTMPIATTGLGSDGFWGVISWGSQMFINAIHIALPIVASLMLVYIALGVMTRVAPQLNIFSVGFPLTLMVGFITIMLFMRTFKSGFERVLSDGLFTAKTLLGG
ncbi:MAG: flagellar biosynthetic protein FliR [Pseudomonadota bacterium]